MKRILIVDDERKVRGIYMRLFRSFGIDYFDVDNVIRQGGGVLDFGEEAK